MNPRIQNLRDTMIADLRTAFDDQHEELAAALVKQRENQEEGEKLTFAVPFSGKLDLEGNKVVTTFSYTVKKQIKQETQCSDPNQMTFDEQD